MKNCADFIAIPSSHLHVFRQCLKGLKTRCRGVTSFAQPPVACRKSLAREIEEIIFSLVPYTGRILTASNWNIRAIRYAIVKYSPARSRSLSRSELRFGHFSPARDFRHLRILYIRNDIRCLTWRTPLPA